MPPTKGQSIKSHLNHISNENLICDENDDERATIHPGGRYEQAEFQHHSTQLYLPSIRLESTSFGDRTGDWMTDWLVKCRGPFELTGAAEGAAGRYKQRVSQSIKLIDHWRWHNLTFMKMYQDKSHVMMCFVQKSKNRKRGAWRLECLEWLTFSPSQQWILEKCVPVDPSQKLSR